MHMSFWWDYIVKNFLIYGCNISSILVLVATCFVLMGVSLFFEYIKMFHARVKQKRMMMTHRQLRSICPSESDTLLTSNPEPSTSSSNAPQGPPPFVITRKDRFVHFVSDMSLWLSQNILGYLLMLIVMLYNGYMVIAIVLGSAIGYFLFGPTVMRINIENCRAMRSTFCMADCGEPDKTALLAPGSAPDPGAGDTSPPVCHATSAIISETATEVVHT